MTARTTREHRIAALRPRLAELDEERAALAAELDELVQMPLGLPPDTAPNMANSDRTHCRRLRK